MKEELHELFRLKMEAHCIYGMCKDIRKEDLERRRNAYKKYIEARNKFVNRSRGK